MTIASDTNCTGGVSMIMVSYRLLQETSRSRNSLEISRLSGFDGRYSHGITCSVVPPISRTQSSKVHAPEISSESPLRPGGRLSDALKHGRRRSASSRRTRLMLAWQRARFIANVDFPSSVTEDVTARTWLDVSSPERRMPVAAVVID